MTDPRAAEQTMKASERRWLRDTDAALNIDDADLDAVIDPMRLRIARAAWRRLAG